MGQKPAILIVDDEPDTLELLNFILSEEGYDVWIMTNGEAALDLLENHIPDLVLLDVRLPKVDGIEICRRIKSSSNSRISSILVIMISAKDSHDDLKEALNAGANDYLTKPFGHDELIDMMKKHLGQY